MTAGAVSHWVFVGAAYGLSALVLAAMAAYVVLDLRRQKRLVAELEARGVARRAPAGRAGAGP